MAMGLPLVVAVIVLDQAVKALVAGEPRFGAMGCLAAPRLRRRHADPARLQRTPFVQPINDLEPRRQFRALQAEGLARWALFALTSLICCRIHVWLSAGRTLDDRTVLVRLVIGGPWQSGRRARVRGGGGLSRLLGPLFPVDFQCRDAAISVGAAFLLLDQLLASRKPRS